MSSGLPVIAPLDPPRERTMTAERRRTFVHLDALRGGAALLVVAGHVRALTFMPFSTQRPAAGRFVLQAFYFATGLGHQAVMIFFVLSGFLIGRSVVSLVEERRWSWRTYLTNRLTRLWLVLLPSLLMTAALDAIGAAHDPLGFYSGQLQSTLFVGPAPPGMVNDVRTFLENAIFLQSVVSPVYGSNGPLWSLSLELWFYIAFPMLALTIAGRGRARARVVHAAVLGATCLWLGPAALAFGVVWLLGVASHLAGRACERRALVLPRAATWIATLALAATLALSRSSLCAGYRGDLLVGVATAVLVTVLSTLAPRVPAPARPFIVTARFSYSLYLSHFPVIVCCWVVWLHSFRRPPALTTFAAFAALLALAIAVAWAIYLGFERHTARVRSWIMPARIDRDVRGV